MRGSRRLQYSTKTPKEFYTTAPKNKTTVLFSYRYEKPSNSTTINRHLHPKNLNSLRTNFSSYDSLRTAAITPNLDAILQLAAFFSARQTFYNKLLQSIYLPLHSSNKQNQKKKLNIESKNPTQPAKRTSAEKQTSYPQSAEYPPRNSCVSRLCPGLVSFAVYAV